MGGGVDGHMVQHAGGGAGDDVDLADAVDLVPEKLHADGVVLGVDGENFHRVPPDPEAVAVKGHVVALVADLGELTEQALDGPLLPGAQRNDHVGVINGVAQAVDTGDGGHDNDVPPLEEGGGGRVAQALDLVVDGAVLLDKCIRVGDIGFGLVVVVVADEILHGVVGEKLPELRAELGGQGLVVGQDQGGALDLFDDLGHGKGLAGAGHAQKRLLVQPQLDPLGQGFDGLRLVPGGGVVADDLKVWHRENLLLKRRTAASGGGCPAGRPCRRL